jgi:hypothetical protein
MWIRKTPEELRKFEFYKLKIFLGFFAILFLIIFLGTKIFGDTIRYSASPSNSVSWHELIERIPQYLIFSFILTFIGSKLDSKSKKKQNDKYICDKCNEYKKDKSVDLCECGGRFIFVDSMKWVNDDGVENNEELKSN